MLLNGLRIYNRSLNTMFQNLFSTPKTRSYSGEGLKCDGDEQLLTLDNLHVKSALLFPNQRRFLHRNASPLLAILDGKPCARCPTFLSGFPASSRYIEDGTEISPKLADTARMISARIFQVSSTERTAGIVFRKNSCKSYKHALREDRLFCVSLGLTASSVIRCSSLLSPYRTNRGSADSSRLKVNHVRSISAQHML